jgi:hypothetical protein
MRFLYLARFIFGGFLYNGVSVLTLDGQQLFGISASLLQRKAFLCSMSV